MKKIYRIIFALHAFVGIGGMVGGLPTILNPEGPLGIPVEMLKNSPFSNFLIPGIILFTIIGLGNVISAITILFKSRFQGYISSVFSWALVIWMVVQCIMINLITILHIIYFVIGIVEVVLSTVILFNQKLFPSNIVVKFYKKVSKNA